MLDVLIFSNLHMPVLISFNFQLILVLIFLIISCKAIAQAIIGILFVFYLLRQDFCYDYMTSQILQICLFIRSSNFNWSSCVTSFFTLIGASFFCLFARLSFLSHVTYLTQIWLPHSQIDFSLLQLREVFSSECVPLQLRLFESSL